MFRTAVVFLMVWGTAFAANPEIETKQADGQNKCRLLLAGDQDSVERSGCCSHHGGVCGCAGGRQQCCDGVLSPSCTCNLAEPGPTN